MDAINKRHTILLVFSFFWVITQGQQMKWERLSEDTIYYGRDYLPDRHTFTFAGPGQMWDFRSLKAPYALSRRIVMAGSSEDKVYANLINGKSSNAILNIAGKSIQMIQIMDDNPVCSGTRLTYTLSPAYKPFFNGVMGEKYAYRGKMRSVFAWPRNKICSWTPTQIPDSCRVTYTIMEEIVVNGEGTLYLPTESTTAFRQSVENRRALTVEIKYGQSWLDVTNQIPGVRLVTTTEYLRFVSTTSGVLMAEIELRDGHQPIAIEFKTHPLVTRVYTEEPSRPDIFAYPNPSYDVVRFQLNDLVFGGYNLKIFNILGLLVKEMNLNVDEDRKTFAVDLQDLQRGTYLYRLQDSSGRIIKTKRIVLIQS